VAESFELPCLPAGKSPNLDAAKRSDMNAKAFFNE